MNPFPNGASVSRMFEDGSGEVLAFFQYEDAAVKFAELLAAEIQDGYWHTYIVASHYDGKLKKFTARAALGESK